MCGTDNNVNVMAEEVKTAPEVQAEAKVEPKVEAKTEEVKETIGQAMASKEKEDSKTVPEAAFLEMKRTNKELTKELKDLKKLIETDAPKDEISENIDEIAKEYDIKPEFLKKLAKSIRKDAEKDIDARVDARVKPLEGKDRADKIEKVFTTHFDKAMEDMPEYKGIVNRGVIKTLSLDPDNQNKTFSQLIEETYGNAIGGKRTLETTTHRGGKTIDKVDFERAGKDQKYYNEVMADPTAKKEYNEGLVERLAAHL